MFATRRGIYNLPIVNPVKHDRKITRIAQQSLKLLDSHFFTNVQHELLLHLDFHQLSFSHGVRSTDLPNSLIWLKLDILNPSINHQSHQVQNEINILP
jgi:hypothetical protein